MRARGFLMAEPPDATLNGEGLSRTVFARHRGDRSNCVSYDPTFGYEVR
jgi:pyruvate dehydrogenase complex dehydrogenase (E1) component